MLTKHNPVVAVGPDASAWAIADEMDAHGVGSVVVVDGKEAPIGIVTDRDLVRRVVATGRDPEKTAASEIMSENVVTGSPDESGSDLLERMRQHQIRRIPLVEKGKVVGIASYDDVLMELAYAFANLAEAVRVELRETARTTARRRRTESREELVDDVRTYLSELEQDARERVEGELERWVAWLRGER